MTSYDGVMQCGPNARLADPRTAAGLVTTASVPAGERLDFWQEIVCRTIAGVEASALAEDHPYEGLIRSRTIPGGRLPDFDLLQVEADAQRVNRTTKLISGQAEESWLLMVQDEGTCSISQGDQSVTLAPGDISFLDTSRPYEVIFPRTFKQSILKMPKLLFDDTFSKHRDLSGIVLNGSAPLTTIARHNLHFLNGFAETIAPSMLPAAASRAIDYLALAVRASVMDKAERARRDFSTLHFEQARAYVAQYLGDASLSVPRIARAAGLSSGHLQDVFRAKSGSSVAEYVRDQRLAACKRDLSDPSMATESITSIAFRWGFSESSSFSRAFRSAFQTSPRRFRRRSPINL